MNAIHITPIKKRVSEASDSGSFARRIVTSVLLFLVAVSLTGCLATNHGLQPKYGAAPKPLVQKKPVTKQDKLMREGKPVNDYVNNIAPSQVRYSIGILNEEPEEGDYPTIQNVAEPQQTLKTEEQREQIEDELRALSQANNS